MGCKFSGAFHSHQGLIPRMGASCYAWVTLEIGMVDRNATENIVIPISLPFSRGWMDGNGVRLMVCLIVVY